MKRRGIWLLGAPLLLALALAGCGNLTGGTSVNTSAATLTTGPITIATDHSAYAPTDAMQITIQNNQPAAIYAYDTQASCSVLTLEVQKNGQWVASNALHCPLGRAAMAVKIAPGAKYTASVGARVMSIGQSASLPAGTYRLALSYYDAPLSGASNAPTATTIYSATLTVSGTVPPSGGAIPTTTGAQPPSK